MCETVDAWQLLCMGRCNVTFTQSNTALRVNETTHISHCTVAYIPTVLFYECWMDLRMNNILNELMNIQRVHVERVNVEHVNVELVNVELVNVGRVNN